VNRQGNATTTYNWQQNAANRADCIESPETAKDLSSASVPMPLNTTWRAAEPMMTIPMVDWSPNQPNRRGWLPTPSPNGAQTASDPWWPDAGNGILASDGSTIVSDPNDAYTPNSPAFQKLWVEHL
jgi:hypothetical protein